jgi:hypothetical protein
MRKAEDEVDVEEIAAGTQQQILQMAIANAEDAISMASCAGWLYIVSRRA